MGETVGCMAGGWISTFIGRRLTLLIFGIPVRYYMTKGGIFEAGFGEIVNFFDGFWIF